MKGQRFLKYDMSRSDGLRLTYLVSDWLNVVINRWR